MVFGIICFNPCLFVRSSQADLSQLKLKKLRLVFGNVSTSYILSTAAVLFSPNSA